MPVFLACVVDKIYDVKWPTCHLSVCLLSLVSAFLSVYLTIYLSACLPACLLACRPDCWPLYVCFRLSVCVQFYSPPSSCCVLPYERFLAKGKSVELLVGGYWLDVLWVLWLKNTPSSLSCLRHTFYVSFFYEINFVVNYSLSNHAMHKLHWIGMHSMHTTSDLFLLCFAVVYAMGIILSVRLKDWN